MKSYQLGPIITIEAGEAITANCFVDNQGKHTVDERAVGVALFDTDSGDQISVQVAGVAMVVAGGAVTVGTHPYVSMDASGRAVASSDLDKTCCGIPLDSSTTAGDLIRVRLI